MITDTEIKVKGFQVLVERFVALIQRKPFDYSKWRQDIDEEQNLEEISRKAMAIRDRKFLRTPI